MLFMLVHSPVERGKRNRQGAMGAAAATEFHRSIAMFFFQFEVTPRTDVHDDQDIAGAIVNSWINLPSRDEALALARSVLVQGGWIVGDPDEAYEVTRDECADNPAALAMFDQALIDTDVMQIHTFTSDEPEEED